jgi:hypothetical protein
MKTALALVALIAVAAPTVAMAQPANPWQGPNLLLTEKRLQEIDAAVQRGDPTIVKARDEAIAAADHFMGVKPNPIVGVFKVPGFYTKQKAVQQQISAQIRGDGRAANALALGFALTRDQKYADKAREFIFAWVGSLTEPKDGGRFVDWFLLQHGGDTALVMSYSFPQFLYAYDILRGLGQISAVDHDAFKLWMQPFIRYHTDEEFFKNNHHNWQCLFLAAAAHCTEDKPLFDRAVKFYKNGMDNHQIARDGSMWRELVREEKAATYTLMALEAMVQFVHIAENHGYVGLRGLVAGDRKTAEMLVLKARTLFKSTGIPADGGNLMAAFGSIREFIVNPNGWVNRYKNVIKKSSVNGPANRTDWGWIFEVAYAWTQDPSWLPFMTPEPYGLQPERAYTLTWATLLFRPV